MSATSVGFLPYGSSDSSVVFANPLTAPLSAANMPYTNVVLAAGPGGPGVGAGPIFDPVKGVKFSDGDTNNSFSCYYELDTPTFSAAVLNALANGGQISFEIEASAVTTNDSTHFSSGFQPNQFSSVWQSNSDMPMFEAVGSGAPAPDRLYLTTAAGSGINLWLGPGPVAVQSQGYWQLGKRLITNDTPNAGQAYFQYSPGQFTSYRSIAVGGPSGQIHSYQKGSFVKVNVGWWGGPFGGVVVVAIDGLKTLVMKRLQTAAGAVSWFQKIGIGGSPTSQWFNSCARFMRNFQVSTAIPTWLTKSGFYRVATFGDSTVQICGSWDVALSGAGGDCTSARVMQRAFNQLGYDIEFFQMQASGTTIDDKNQTPDTTTLDTYKDAITPKFLGNGAYLSPPAAGLPWPDVVLIQGGINDWAGDGISGQQFQNPPIVLQDSRFLASYQRLINYFMWGQYTAGVIAGGTRTPVKRVLCQTPLSPRWRSTAQSGWGFSAPLTGPGTGYDAFQYVLKAIRSLPAWWNASYPNLAGLISVSDYYNSSGADSYAFSGPLGAGSAAPPNLSVDGTHPTIAGSYAIGACQAQALLQAFVQS